MEGSGGGGGNGACGVMKKGCADEVGWPAY